MKSIIDIHERNGGKKANVDGCETADFFETGAKQRRWSKKGQKDDKQFHKTGSLDP